MATETFTKLESRIIASTIWQEDDHTRLLWVTMLALADKDGYVGASVPGLAGLARIPLESCERALTKFLGPDKYSRSQENDGRRIVVADRGWILINYEAIRNTRDTEERREYEAERKRKYRAKLATKEPNVPDVPSMSRDVPSSPALSAQAETEAEEDTEAESKVKILPPPAPKKSAKQLVEEFNLEQKHRDWAAKNAPSVPVDAELEAWKDRERTNGYTTGKAPGIPVRDPQAAFYTAMRNAESWGLYRKSSGNGSGASNQHPPNKPPPQSFAGNTPRTIPK